MLTRAFISCVAFLQRIFKDDSWVYRLLIMATQALLCHGFGQNNFKIPAELLSKTFPIWLNEYKNPSLYSSQSSEPFNFAKPFAPFLVLNKTRHDIPLDILQDALEALRLFASRRSPKTTRQFIAAYKDWRYCADDSGLAENLSNGPSVVFQHLLSTNWFFSEKVVCHLMKASSSIHPKHFQSLDDEDEMAFLLKETFIAWHHGFDNALFSREFRNSSRLVFKPYIFIGTQYGAAEWFGATLLAKTKEHIGELKQIVTSNYECKDLLAESVALYQVGTHTTTNATDTDQFLQELVQKWPLRNEVENLINEHLQFLNQLCINNDVKAMIDRTYFINRKSKKPDFSLLHHRTKMNEIVPIDTSLCNSGALPSEVVVSKKRLEHAVKKQELKAKKTRHRSNRKKLKQSPHDDSSDASEDSMVGRIIELLDTDDESTDDNNEITDDNSTNLDVDDNDQILADVVDAMDLDTEPTISMDRAVANNDITSGEDVNATGTKDNIEVTENDTSTSHFPEATDLVKDATTQDPSLAEASLVRGDVNKLNDTNTLEGLQDKSASAKQERRQSINFIRARTSSRASLLGGPLATSTGATFTTKVMPMAQDLPAKDEKICDDASKKGSALITSDVEESVPAVTAHTEAEMQSGTTVVSKTSTKGKPKGKWVAPLPEDQDWNTITRTITADTASHKKKQKRRARGKQKADAHSSDDSVDLTSGNKVVSAGTTAPDLGKAQAAIDAAKIPVLSSQILERTKTIDDSKPVDKVKPTQGSQPIEKVKLPIEKAKQPIERAKKPAEVYKQTQSLKPVEKVKQTVEKAKPIDKVKPVQGKKPAEQVKQPPTNVEQPLSNAGAEGKVKPGMRFKPTKNAKSNDLGQVPNAVQQSATLKAGEDKHIVGQHKSDSKKGAMSSNDKSKPDADEAETMQALQHRKAKINKKPKKNFAPAVSNESKPLLSQEKVSDADSAKTEARATAATVGTKDIGSLPKNDTNTDVVVLTEVKDRKTPFEMKFGDLLCTQKASTDEVENLKKASHSGDKTSGASVSPTQPQDTVSESKSAEAIDSQVAQIPDAAEVDSTSGYVGYSMDGENVVLQRDGGSENDLVVPLSSLDISSRSVAESPLAQSKKSISVVMPRTTEPTIQAPRSDHGASWAQATPFYPSYPQQASYMGAASFDHQDTYNDQMMPPQAYHHTLTGSAYDPFHHASGVSFPHDAPYGMMPNPPVLEPFYGQEFPTHVSAPEMYSQSQSVAYGSMPVASSTNNRLGSGNSPGVRSPFANNPRNPRVVGNATGPRPLAAGSDHRNPRVIGKSSDLKTLSKPNLTRKESASADNGGTVKSAMSDGRPEAAAGSQGDETVRISNVNFALGARGRPNHKRSLSVGAFEGDLQTDFVIFAISAFDSPATAGDQSKTIYMKAPRSELPPGVFGMEISQFFSGQSFAEQQKTLAAMPTFSASRGGGASHL